MTRTNKTQHDTVERIPTSGAYNNELSMTDHRPRYNELLNQSKPALEDRLRTLLPPASRDRLTGSPNAGLLEGVFERITPNEDPHEFVTSWHNYDQSWNRGKSAATALRMLLTEQVGLPRYAVISGYTIPTLSKMILGIEAADDGVPRGDDLHIPLTLPLDIDPPLPDPPELPTRSRRDGIVSLSDLDQIVSTFYNPPDKFAVYVLDCTPVADRERRAMWELRRDSLAKHEAGCALEEKERFAHALNAGELIYYVGFTKDIVDRMNRHRDGAASGGGYFTNFFKPNGVVDIEWFDTEAGARTAEAARARELCDPGESLAYFN